MTASDPRVGEIQARLAKKPGVQGMYSFHGADVAYLLAELADRDEKLARVEALHVTKFYDKWGRSHDTDKGCGGWCNVCQRFDGPACLTMAAVAAAGWGGE